MNWLVAMAVLLALAATSLAGDIEGVVSINCDGDVTYLPNLSVIATVDGSTYTATSGSDGTFTLTGLPNIGSAQVSVSGMPTGILPYPESPGGVTLSSATVALQISLDDAVGIQVPAYYETQCGTLDPSVSGEAVSTGYCPATISYSDRATLTAFYLITYRTWTVAVGSTTMNGLQIMKSQDTEPPVLTVPPPPANSECGGSVPPPAEMATVTDNCSGGIQAEYVDVVAMGCPIKVTRTWMAADLSGNIATSVQTFELVDTTPPTFTTRPTPYQGPCGEPVEEWFSGYAGSVVVDACYPTVSMSASTATCSNGTTATFAAADACGNSVLHRVFIAYTEHCDNCP